MVTAAARTSLSDSLRLYQPLPMSFRHVRTWFLMATTHESRRELAKALIEVLCMCSNSSSRQDLDVSLFRNPTRRTRLHSLRTRCRTWDMGEVQHTHAWHGGWGMGVGMVQQHE
jgi:hypothetical protein